MTLEGYLAEVDRIIRENFRENDVTGSMTAAKAGLLVREVLRCSPEDVGLSKFKDALCELQRRGKVRIGPNSKDALAIWISSGSEGVTVPPPTTSSTVATSAAVESRPFRRLRNPLWLALVSEFPVGKRYMNVRTGDISVGQFDPPKPETEWVQIPAIEPRAEKEAATHFLESEGLTDSTELSAALASDRWYTEFPTALRVKDPSLAGHWNRSRSERIARIAEEWRQEYNIPSPLIYEQRADSGRGRRGTLVSPPLERDSLKKLLLEALSRMTTNELLNLPIPARHFVAIMRPELLNE